jgi:hypothetical protein
VKKSQSFNPREIAVALNNAMVLSSRPTSLSTEIDEKRLPKIREFTEAYYQPMLELVDDNVLCPEEAVKVLASAALMVHLLLVLKTEKLPLVK